MGMYGLLTERDYVRQAPNNECSVLWQALTFALSLAATHYYLLELELGRCVWRPGPGLLVAAHMTFALW
eukprot:scaffold10353_cov127-Isochrysis_galbana.AAC.3